MKSFVLDKVANETGCDGPESLLIDGGMAKEERDRILHEWEQDQIALLRAADENMNDKNSDENAGDMLSRIKKMEEILNDKEEG